MVGAQRTAGRQAVGKLEPGRRTIRHGDRYRAIELHHGRREEPRELIVERGFDSLSVNELAQRCGISVGGMYRHIRTKTDVLVMA